MLFSFEKVRTTKFAQYRISRKSSSCVRFLNQIGVIDIIYCGMAIALHAFLSRNISSKQTKNQHPLSIIKIKQNYLTIFVISSVVCFLFCQ